ncbi:hypothetical protein PROFUN_00515 [Planoprotostelium fungivorum]|uniref:Fibronectin type-III domain-containing protein n=1 Tax=Planoprotostelium fungivorum TaxID=1890364 RepID=A0A2P6N118_9EUKA|nr:hypothetical protein PROFUN_00515 [Planoprotostelium fungivorum]
MRCGSVLLAWISFLGLASIQCVLSDEATSAQIDNLSSYVTQNDSLILNWNCSTQCKIDLAYIGTQDPSGQQFFVKSNVNSLVIPLSNFEFCKAVELPISAAYVMKGGPKFMVRPSPMQLFDMPQNQTLDIIRAPANPLSTDAKFDETEHIMNWQAGSCNCSSSLNNSYYIVTRSHGQEKAEPIITTVPSLDLKGLDLTMWWDLEITFVCNYTITSSRTEPITVRFTPPGNREDWKFWTVVAVGGFLGVTGLIWCILGFFVRRHRKWNPEYRVSEPLLVYSTL